MHFVREIWAWLAVDIAGYIIGLIVRHNQPHPLGIFALMNEAATLIRAIPAVIV